MNNGNNFFNAKNITPVNRLLNRGFLRYQIVFQMSIHTADKVFMRENPPPAPKKTKTLFH